MAKKNMKSKIRDFLFKDTLKVEGRDFSIEVDSDEEFDERLAKLKEEIKKELLNDFKTGKVVEEDYKCFEDEIEERLEEFIVDQNNIFYANRGAKLGACLFKSQKEKINSQIAELEKQKASLEEKLQTLQSYKLSKS